MDPAARQQFEQTALPLLDNMYGFALRLTRDPAQAEDLVQDTMVRAYRHWHTFNADSNVKAWLFRIARNSFIDGYHKRRKARDMADTIHTQVQSLGQATAIAHSNSTPPGPEDAVEMRMTRRRILDALESLPDDYRIAVTLADLEGLAYKEIAEVMNCPTGTVMSRLYRGRKLLHKLLHDHAIEVGFVTESPSPPVSLDRFRASQNKA